MRSSEAAYLPHHGWLFARIFQLLDGLVELIRGQSVLLSYTSQLFPPGSRRAVASDQAIFCRFTNKCDYREFAALCNFRWGQLPSSSADDLFM